MILEQFFLIYIFSFLTRLFVLFFKVKGLFNELGVSFNAIELDQCENGDEILSVLKNKVGKTSVPQVFVNRNYVGGCDDTYSAQQSGKLNELLKAANYDYDLIVIGGGSGGLAASKVGFNLVLNFDFTLILLKLIWTNWFTLFFLQLNRKLPN